MTREDAEQKLYEIFHIERFYDEQWKAVSEILQGHRVLMIERTGFGKSLCYQFPATQFPGVTVVFSTLIALMRDQVEALRRCGIPAAYINSEQTPEENECAIEKAKNKEIKILYIAPERQANANWREAVREMDLSMVVVDEAHTISTWGHDFRPAFRRIVELVKLLPESFPVLATTATATARVQHDIEQQIGHGITTLRGSLNRKNFHLYVIRVHSEDEKMVWIADHLNKITGTGIIYTGTRSSVERYAQWLQFADIEAVGYSAALDADSRKEIEAGLKANRWKCVISTNALGMGIDKPDIRFVIHTQIPASPIHYYQEIGRAGRDGQPTVIILFYNEHLDDNNIQEDSKLPRAFIDGARPKEDKYQRVVEALKEEPLGERELMKQCNLKQNEVRVIVADLKEQAIIKEAYYGKSKKYEYQYDAKALDMQGFETLRQAKLRDLKAMIDYVYTDEPRMKYLCNFLDNNEQEEYMNCDNTNLPKRYINPLSANFQRLRDYRDTYFPVLEMKGDGEHLLDGVAASYYGDSTVGSSIHRSKYEGNGDFPDFLLRLTLKAFWKTFGSQEFDLVMFVPPTRSGDLVKNFATKFAHALQLPISEAISKTRETREQKILQNSYNKKDNVADAFDVGADIAGKRIILVDDIYDSGATLREIGRVLVDRGADKVVPIVIAKTVGGAL